MAEQTVLVHVESKSQGANQSDRPGLHVPVHAPAWLPAWLSVASDAGMHAGKALQLCTRLYAEFPSSKRLQPYYSRTSTKFSMGRSLSF